MSKFFLTLMVQLKREMNSVTYLENKACLQEHGQWYEYRIGHRGPTRRFRAPPETGPEAEFSFIAYGDMGESKHKAAKSPG